MSVHEVEQVSDDLERSQPHANLPGDVVPLQPPRPLKFRLSENDVLVLMHIEKTGGTTLDNILRQFYPPEVYYSLPDEWDAWDAFHKMSAENRARLRLVRAHGPRRPQFLSRLPVYITMLRNPVDRIVSFYAHQKREGRLGRKNMSLEEFVDSMGREVGYVDDLQACRVAGIEQKLRHVFSNETTLAIAKARLDQFAFFGLTEYFDQSVRLMCHTFSWPSVQEFAILNRTSKNDEPEITPTIRRAIVNRNTLDMAFYSYAKDVFMQRVRAMNEAANE